MHPSDRECKKEWCQNQIRNEKDFAKYRDLLPRGIELVSESKFLKSDVTIIREKTKTTQDIENRGEGETIRSRECKKVTSQSDRVEEEGGRKSGGQSGGRGAQIRSLPT